MAELYIGSSRTLASQRRATMSGAGSSQTNQNPASKTLSTFEFTKRKRWADILITGLTDVIIFVLSPEGKVLYCGTAVTELLGWNETDILDLRLDDFIIGAPAFSGSYTCLIVMRA